MSQIDILINAKDNATDALSSVGGAMLSVAGIAAGGPIDLEARLYTPRIGALLGQSFVLDFKPGASGTIGAAFSAVASGYLVRGYYTVPATAATLRLNLDISLTPAAGGYVEFAAVTVRNLTTLGLA
jgi:tripartite-type tricarboxylate transporter receptor subunit TctC